jgi:ribosome biogenesis GTPase / thiamine phosphate phosphatase
MQWGTVTRVDAKVCRVDIDGEDVVCRLRGKLHTRSRGQSRPLAAGDRVEVKSTGDGEGVVERVEERRSKLSRPSADARGREQVVAANIDRILIAASVRDPVLKTGFIDRLLVTAEMEGIEPFIFLNKVDLLPDPGEIQPFIDLYASLGYPVLLVSALGGQGIARVSSILAGRNSVIVGQSGVGKSTLLNAVQPGLRLRTAEVSASTSKGRHTTTAASLIRLEIGGYVVDTPGVREFGLWKVGPDELAGCFPEMVSLLGGCRFRGCSHTHEPGCAVKDDVGVGVDPERYGSYERILASILEDPNRPRSGTVAG